MAETKLESVSGDEQMITGGCACGAIRYRLASVPFDSGYCHCKICQRSAGAPVLAFATVPLGDFIIERGEPRRRRSSDFGERWFCPDCGTQLAMHVDHQPDTIDFTLGPLDDTSRFAPSFHIWCASRIGWLEIADGLPRYDRFRPQTRGL